MRIAPEGWIVLGPMLGVCALAGALGVWLMPVAVGWPIALAAAGLGGWGLWFFRDPERTAPTAPAGHDVIVSPADGRVIKIDMAPLPKELREAGGDGAARQRIAIFLNLFNVHVNRTPAAGRIARLAYVPGTFVNASFDKASEHNERSLALMVDGAGREIGFVQIAGLVARRIVNHLRVGQEVGLGERFGLIRFGSRAEVYLPAGAECQVRVGASVRAGETVLALARVERADARVERREEQPAGAAR